MNDETNLPDKQFIEYILKLILQYPDDIVVDRTVDELGVLITVKVNPDDMGTLIGKKGQTVGSLRTILRVIGAKNNARVNLKILDDNHRQTVVQSSDLDSSLENVDI